MLGKTAGGLFWMQRYLERSENIARLVDAGFRIALTRSEAAEDEWASVLTTAGVRQAYAQRYEKVDGSSVINFLLRDKTNPSSVLSVIEAARNNARLVRTALTREVWEATNECWMTLKEALRTQISDNELPDVLSLIRQQSAQVRGAQSGTMMRNDIYFFAQLGTFVERADSTARFLDVKYYVLLPSLSYVGSSLDNVQWETILRSVSAYRAFRWLNPGETNPRNIAQFMILDQVMPRSLSFCASRMAGALEAIAREYGGAGESLVQASALSQELAATNIDMVVDNGLHQFIQDFIKRNNSISAQIEQEFRFYH
ncbi:putative alpha-E superfamily protein [Blastomonas natatoria]|uniref:Putative alpha-E superfamily protein n=1 Tax=Blastomonas natatoria TaxID=34015 RepID=A0A2V3VB56_9SPHN|nr:alpha-E domain-containing protein [Blastomonas natatoria]PXW79046.1 putative alpha-E superfamily protein [Blastomonas natatoria]